MSITHKAIEAAAVVMLANGLNHTAYDAEDLAAHALESAAPSIASQALREAADALTREEVPDGWGIPTYENYGNWLRARAEELEPTA